MWVVGRYLLGRLLPLGLGQEDGVDVGQHTAGSDGHATEELVELLVVADGQLALPGSSRISAIKYSRTTARYTGAPDPTRAA